MAIEIETYALEYRISDLLGQIDGKMSYGDSVDVAPLRDSNAIAALRRAVIILTYARDHLKKILASIPQ